MEIIPVTKAFENNACILSYVITKREFIKSEIIKAKKIILVFLCVNGGNCKKTHLLLKLL